MQRAIPFPANVAPEAYEIGARSSGETHGVVHTRAHVVDLILDLVGYEPKSKLSGMRLLEPSCGTGSFVTAAVARLIASQNGKRLEYSSLRDAILTFDIDENHVRETRERVRALLQSAGLNERDSASLARTWVRHGDFLLQEDLGEFDYIVGNPPYIRIEQIPPVIAAEYRARFQSLFDRADIYVAFIERCMNLLSSSGKLSFICANRWTVNRYGKVLRAMVAERFRVEAYIDLHQASPFESEVIAYPSIFVIARGKSRDVAVAHLKEGTVDEVRRLRAELSNSGPAEATEAIVQIYAQWFEGEAPWVLGTPAQLAVLRDLEERFPLLEENARVGIGVATGKDSVFLVDRSCDIEPDRLVPLVMRKDIQKGSIVDSGQRVINVFRDSGGCVDLADYPRLAKYLSKHEDEIRGRHVSKKNVRDWYRTIDRVFPDLVSRPKLLIPDIAGANEIAFDEGRYYPHHNLYFVTSDKWDLEVLGALLSSRVALFFVWSYAVKMRGRYLRFQAQYLRRIRVPEYTHISASMSKKLVEAFRQRDFQRIDKLALVVYGLSALPEFDFVDTRS